MGFVRKQETVRKANIFIEAMCSLNWESSCHMWSSSSLTTSHEVSSKCCCIHFSDNLHI